MLRFWVLAPGSVIITTFPTIPHTRALFSYLWCLHCRGAFTVVCLCLSGRIVSALPRLCVLDVSCNALLGQEAGGAGFGQLAASLSHAATLNTLRLQACGLTADSLGDLGKFSVILDIFCPLLVRIPPSESKVLALNGRILALCCAAGGALRSLPALRELDLSSNKSLAGGLDRLTLHLAHLMRLESLGLHHCGLKRDDLEALSERAHA